MTNALPTAAVALIVAVIAGIGLRETASPRLAAEAEEPVRYGRDVRPIFADRCFRCHGSDAAAREADLRLDVRESAVADRDGRAAIVPGAPDKSELWRRITSDDPEVVMPHPQSKLPRLSAAEREVIRKWIAQGAEYEPHWAFVPPKRPALPQVRNGAWCRNEVDRFVLARLEAAGVEPSPEAAKETLARRVFLDLTALPPTPEETDAFTADERSDAFERLVERLLGEEPYKSRYAERMATPWLDAARYADTCGIHTDAGRSIWPWRDWVLRAFRDDVPFDVFLTEQLAGDLIAGATRDQIVASGFNRNHVTSDEGGAIPEELLVEYAVDRAATAGSVFLGLTIGCARCHDHKFDPVSQEDFYRLFSFFNSVDEPGLYSQLLDPKRAHEPNIAVPSLEQERERERLRAELKKREEARDQAIPGENRERETHLAKIASEHGLSFEPARVTAAVSTGGATLTVEADGSVLASGENPATDDFVLTQTLGGAPFRLLLLEALGDPSLPPGRVGRSPNGNAVLTGVEAEARSEVDPTQRKQVRFTWAWADEEQDDQDFRVVNALDPEDDLGWAVASHKKAGGRTALFVAEEEFGFEGGTVLEVRLWFRSQYQQHAFGRVRLRAGRLDEAGVALLPVAQGEWYRVGPFPAASGSDAFKTAYEPEALAVLDRKRNFGFGNQTYVRAPGLEDGKPHVLPAGTHAIYLARRLYAASPRKLALSLGSDDAIKVFLDGREVFAHEIERTIEADPDRITIELAKGAATIALKIVNTGGEGGFSWSAPRNDGELTGDLAIALLPADARHDALQARLASAWRAAFSPGHRAGQEQVVEIASALAKLESEIPLTMVMRELPKPRETFVLKRGEYQQPDKSRPVTRGVPAVLGALSAGAPADRLGLARWMTAAGNPLVARVAVNRLWETVFGAGLVRTSEDFGNRGEWPSHPELLDWLAVEFREGGWDVKAMLRRIITSSTYRQASRVRPELRDKDPDNRLLASFPRRRLGAEAIRDQALYASGLLVERFGGPSVKPYQPPGLWEEVAMPACNTKVYQRGEGADLWRRSLYTFWKRASPPPALLTFDAPTRESCTVRRASTNTPLQALALWNDEQLVEAARVLAQRTLAEGGDDGARIARMFRRCTGRAPDREEAAALERALAALRERYAKAPEDAEKLLRAGVATRPAEIKPAELAAWMLVASAVLDIDATVTRS